MLRPPRRLLTAALAASGFLLLACSGTDPYSDKPPAAAADAKPADAKPTDAQPADAKAPDGKPAEAKAPDGKLAVPTRHEDGKPLGKVLDTAPLPLVKMLGQSPPEAESHLGPPLPDSKGGMKNTCVRYLPEKTWFRCKHAWQRYSDKTKTFEVVHVIYEDGKVSAIAFEGIPGKGEFDPRQALRIVGLELPGEPKQESPQADVTVWSWWNSSARLLVHDRQYRARVSTVGGKWETAKVEIMLNDVLTEDERSRVFDPKVGPDAVADDAE